MIFRIRDGKDIREAAQSMNLLMIPVLAVKALRRNIMRSGLTTLGIVIGVSAVICVVAIGEGASAMVERAITNIGANLVWIEAGGVNRGGVRTGAGGTRTLTLADYEAIKAHVSQITNLTPQADTRVQVVYGNQNWGTSVRGVGPEYLALKNWTVVRGGMYTETDVQRAGRVCLLGQTVVDQLFGSQEAVGETIRVRDLPCERNCLWPPLGTTRSKCWTSRTAHTSRVCQDFANHRASPVRRT
jgi:putative ABC transport system permease protein